MATRKYTIGPVSAAGTYTIAIPPCTNSSIQVVSTGTATYSVHLQNVPDTPGAWHGTIPYLLTSGVAPLFLAATTSMSAVDITPATYVALDVSSYTSGTLTLHFYG